MSNEQSIPDFWSSNHLRALTLAKRFLPKEDTTPVPEVIYHYCPISSFKGIVQSGEVWASHHSSMEDTSETRHFFNMLKERLEPRINQLNKGYISRVVRTIEINLKDYFIACFSKQPDIASQWDSYAQKGEGIAIGFFTESFGIPNRIPFYCLGQRRNAGVFPVEYGVEIHQGLVKDLVELIMGGFYGNTPPSLECQVLTTKPMAYSDEQEVRIVEIQMMQTNANPDEINLRTPWPERHYRYRQGFGDKEIVFRSFRFHRPQRRCSIHSIWRGPNCYLSKKQIEVYLEENGIDLECGVTQGTGGEKGAL